MFDNSRVESELIFDRLIAELKKKTQKKTQQEKRVERKESEESFTVFPFDEERKYLTSLSPLALDASRHLGLPFLFFISI